MNENVQCEKARPKGDKQKKHVLFSKYLQNSLIRDLFKLLHGLSWCCSPGSGSVTLYSEGETCISFDIFIQLHLLAEK